MSSSSRFTVLPWILLTVWSAWLFGMQAWCVGLAAPAALSAFWVPDLGLALAIGLGARLPTSDLPMIGLCVGLARASISVDPPAAVLAAYLGVVAVARALRSVVEIRSPFATGALAAVLSLGVSVWLRWVHDEVALASIGPGMTRAALDLQGIAPPGAWRTAVATGLAAALLAPLLARLPGLTPLHRRRSWRVGASSL